MVAIVFPVCAVVFVFFLKAFIKANQEFNEKRKVFVEYLDRKKDVETLKAIGEINIFDARERWYPSYISVCHALENKILQTNDENFMTFYIAYKAFIKRFLLTMPFVFLSVLISVVCIMSFFKK